MSELCTQLKTETPVTPPQNVYLMAAALRQSYLLAAERLIVGCLAPVATCLIVLWQDTDIVGNCDGLGRKVQ